MLKLQRTSSPMNSIPKVRNGSTKIAKFGSSLIISCFGGTVSRPCVNHGHFSNDDENTDAVHYTKLECMCDYGGDKEVEEEEEHEKTQKILKLRKLSNLMEEPKKKNLGFASMLSPRRSTSHEDCIASPSVKGLGTKVKDACEQVLRMGSPYMNELLVGNQFLVPVTSSPLRTFNGKDGMETLSPSPYPLGTPPSSPLRTFNGKDSVGANCPSSYSLGQIPTHSPTLTSSSHDMMKHGTRATHKQGHTQTSSRGRCSSPRMTTKHGTKSASSGSSPRMTTKHGTKSATLSSSPRTTNKHGTKSASSRSSPQHFPRVASAR